MNIILVFILLSSCSILQQKENRNFEYIIGKDKGHTNSSVIEYYLKKESTMAGGNYLINVLPLSKPLLEARASVFSYKTGEPFNIASQSFLKRFYNNRTCFEINFTIVETEKANDLSKWKFVLIDSDEITYDLFLESNYALIRSEVGRGFRKIPQWLGSTVVCTKRVVKIGHGFDIKIKSNYVQWPFSDNMLMTWLVIPPEANLGENYKKRKVQRYRGW